MFEGWYYKIVDPAGERPMAMIPGVFLGEDRHAFIQVLDGHAAVSHYHRFDLEAFTVAPERFDVRIGPNRFSPASMHLDLEAVGDAPLSRVRGEVCFDPWVPWPVTLTRPGAMGPYAFAPFMQCYHGILGLDHGLQGQLEVDGAQTVYDGGRGYVEKDWGKGFPEAYTWVQSNHFGRPGVCVTASVATIPWLTGAFRGFLAGFLLDGTLHQFTTYNGSAIDSLDITDTHLHLVIHNPTHRLVIEAEKGGGALLHAPYDQVMLERVAETMTSTVSVRLKETASGALRFEGVGRHACLELVGPLAKIVGE